MAQINLLPSSKERAKRTKRETAESPFVKPLKAAASILAFLTLLVCGSWYIVSTQTKNKENETASLDKKLSDLKTGSKEIEVLNIAKEKLNEKLFFYQKAIGDNVLWSRKLTLINKSLPSQIWLTSIYTEVNPKKMLVIKGSAVSLVESEIIDSISKFVNRLKEEPDFSDDFSEIKLGALLSEKKENLDIMNFTLFCEFKPG